MAYTRPIRNPLRRSLSGVRGLGDVAGPPMDVMGDLPLVGPYTNPNPVTAAQLGIAASAQNPSLPAAGPQTFTNWLNTNSRTLLWVGAVALGVMLLSRLAR